jgi:pimeloyl-ACP methyl ester carboxylesterase
VRRIVAGLIVAFGLVYLAGCGVIANMQRSLIYHPQPAVPVKGGDTLVVESGTERLLVTTREHDGKKAVIYFGGNAEQVELALPALSEAFPDRAIYLMHYRGYGGSTGQPTEEGLEADGLALFDSVSARHPLTSVIGRSLGTGIAIRVAAKRPAASLVLITPYYSIEDLAERQFPFLPVRWILLDKYESWRIAPLVHAPTLVVEAEDDEVIPRASTEALLGRFGPGVARLQVLSGTGHNTISMSPLYVESLKAIP